MKLLLDGQETDRLAFRKLKPSDFDAWLPFRQDARSMEYWKGTPVDPLAACQEWFDRIFYRYNHKLEGMNALIAKNSGDFVGQCGLLIQQVDEVEELEIGYSMLPKYRQMGYTTEAAKKCKSFAFENSATASLISIIQANNEPSKKVALNNGMFKEKTTIYCNNTVGI